jgi:class 3 adenylate cyclase
VRAAEQVRDALTADGLEVRIGIHVGDIDRRGDDVSGLGVVVAARAMAVADAGQIAVTAAVATAVIGQTATFEMLGSHELKGVPGVWELYRLVAGIRRQG